MVGGWEYRGPSEYEQLLTEITPVLENVPLTELSEEDLSFLSSETGLVSQSTDAGDWDETLKKPNQANAADAKSRAAD